MPTEHLVLLLIQERDELNRAIDALQGPIKGRGDDSRSNCRPLNISGTRPVIDAIKSRASFLTSHQNRRHNTCSGKCTMPTHVSKHCLCSQRVSIICSDMDGWWHTVQGNLEELEEGSALVLADGPISSNKKVRICCGSKQLKGTVESCAHDEVLGFFIEVRFDSDSQWSERSFTPAHLLRLTSKAPLRAAG